MCWHSCPVGGGLSVPAGAQEKGGTLRDGVSGHSRDGLGLNVGIFVVFSNLSDSVIL